MGKCCFTKPCSPAISLRDSTSDEQYRAVTYANAVTGLVRFGVKDYPTIAPAYLDFLRQEIGPDDVQVLEASMEEGDEVEIAEGPFRGLRAIVQRYMPAQDRVKVLMEILGNDQLVDVPTSDLVGLRYQ